MAEQLLSTESQSPALTVASPWHVALALVREVESAGFAVSSYRSFSTHDGAAWSCKLKRNGKLVAEASNGGYGGPDIVEPPLVADAVKAAAAREAFQSAVRDLWALPAVQAFVRAFEHEVLDFLPEPQRTQRKAEVDAINSFPLNEETIGNIVATVAERRDTIKRLRKMVAGRLAWAPAGAAFGEYRYFPADDTPENRAQAEAKSPAIFEGSQGYVADLLNGL